MTGALRTAADRRSFLCKGYLLSLVCHVRHMQPTETRRTLLARLPMKASYHRLPYANRVFVFGVSFIHIKLRSGAYSGIQNHYVSQYSYTAFLASEGTITGISFGRYVTVTVLH